MTESVERMLILFVSAMVAGIFVFLFPKILKPHLKFLLAFSGAFLLGIAVTHILPEAYEAGGKYVGLFIIAGFLLQIVLEYFSGGIEHGHTRLHGHLATGSAVSWTMFLSLFLHAFTESIPLGFHDHEHVGHVHHGYLWAIVVHKVPITIALVSLLLGLNTSRPKIILFLILFALAAPLGILINPLLHLADQASIFAYIMALTGGIILHVSTTILLESSENHRFNLYKMLVIIAGFALAIFSH